jgi:hypothetical protein
MPDFLLQAHRHKTIASALAAMNHLLVCMDVPPMSSVVVNASMPYPGRHYIPDEGVATAKFEEPHQPHP